MATNFVTECLDSKLVPLGTETTQEAHNCFLRLRLHFLARILFGDTIVVPQGWALDSVAFIVVAGEIANALDQLKKGQFEYRHVARCNPFKMELHIGGTDYTDVLSMYLQRDDCHWSGLPVLRTDIDTRRRFLHDLKVLSRNARFDPDAYASAANDALLNPEVASSWADVAKYFMENSRDRILRVEWEKNFYASSVSTSLLALDQLEPRDAQTESAVPQLKHFRALTAQNPHLISSVSSVLDAADAICGEDAIAAIRHISNFAQIHSVAHVANCDASAPIVSSFSRNGVLLGDKLLRRAFAQFHPAGLLIEQNLTAIPELASSLAKADWSDVWKSVLLLSQDKGWVELVKSLQSNPEPVDTLRSSKLFKQMEDMLTTRCPALGIEISGAEGLGLKLNDPAWSKVFGRVLGAAGGAIVGAIAIIYLPGSIVPFGLATLANWVASDFIAPKVDPFKGGRFATRATVFRLMR